MEALQADYVIVGAGTAGCVLASRLSEDTTKSVLVIEAGPEYRGLNIHIPAAIGALYEGGKYHWDYKSQPEQYAGDKVLPYKMGRIVGGSSAINGLVWVRGNPKDFNDWEAEGCAGWGYASLRPIFLRVEAFKGPQITELGRDGPIPVTMARPELQPLSRAFLIAAEQAGERINHNYNGMDQDGFCALQRNTHQGRRGDVYEGYIKPVKKRPNLRILSKSAVKQVLFEGRRAIGVKIYGEGGERRALANREVVLSAGAIASPQLLEVSGVGSSSVLSQNGVEVLHSLPGVGENLHTHPTVSLAYSCLHPLSILNVTRGPGKVAAAIRWLLTRTGPAATNHFEAGAFIRARPDADRPDCFLVFLPLALSGTTGSIDAHGFQVYIDLLGCRSRGQSHIVSKDMSQQPDFTFNFLKDPSDLEAFRSSIGKVREVIAQPAFEGLVQEELRPGRDVVGQRSIDEWIRANTGISHHLVGSCKMGPSSDPAAVVGPDLKVHGLDGLRVADASIMPSITSGNTHAATIVIGEKAAELVSASRG